MHAAGDAYRAGVAPRPARLPQPRRSFGAGGEYDDGDISDEDADPGDEAVVPVGRADAEVDPAVPVDSSSAGAAHAARARIRERAPTRSAARR